MSDHIDTNHAVKTTAKKLPTRIYGLTAIGVSVDGLPNKVVWTFDTKELAFKTASRCVEIGLMKVQLVEADLDWRPIHPESEPKTARGWLAGYLKAK